MANEAILVEGPYQCHDFTVATGTAIPQFTLMQMGVDRTAVISAGANVFAGIAMTEKTTTDGVTNLGLLTNSAIVELTDSGSGITVGSRVMLSAANTIKAADAAGIAAGKDFGKALETFTAAQVKEVLLD